MITFRHWIICGMLALGGAACSFTAPAPNRDGNIIVVGDSILAWHRNSGRSIPKVVERSTGLTVSDASISGAQFLGPQGIPTQYVASDWDWVIVNGGGNDLDAECQTPIGQRVLDELAARQARLAASNLDVIFVDSGLVIGSGDAAAYSADLVHPSPRGAALVGELIASVIALNAR